MQANTEIHALAEADWGTIERQHAEWFDEDQRAAIRPELSAAWLKLRTALSEFAYDLAVALARAAVQERRGAGAGTVYRHAARAFDRASSRLCNC